MTLLAATEWSDALIAIAGIAMVTILVGIVTWQLFATGRAGLQSRREGEYRKLVEELSATQRETTAELQRANEALAQLREQTHELERALQEVDRVLKAVE
jgi:Tfp pilus assembly protein PilO